MPICERCKQEKKEELLKPIQYPKDVFTLACPSCYDDLNYARIHHNRKYPNKPTID